MDRSRNHVLTIAAVFCGLFAVSQADAVSLTVVQRNTWAAGVNLPSYVSMNIYVPSKIATKPPIVVSIHACQTPVGNQVNSMTKFLAAADKNGFIMIFPDNSGQNCWDVGSTKALTHDGGGDPHAIAQMVRYALKTYHGDSSRVYVVGGSSGGMMTQALLAIYPELFTAGAPRAGVPCGCWAESYSSSNQWSDPCAGGKVSKTAQQWGDLVRAINPSYTGHRPRVQIFQGESDQTISFNNFNESIKEWTNVLNLSANPTSTDKVTLTSYTYNRKFWKNSCGYTVLEAWSAPGQPHSMTYEEDSIMTFFGLNVSGGQDPELAVCNTGIRDAIRTADAHKNFFFKEHALVMDNIQAEEVTVRIMNTSGRILYNGNCKISPKTASITIPLSFLKSGYYISSAVFNEKNNRIDYCNIHFALVK